MTDYDEIDQMLSHLRGRGDKLCSDAADEIERLRARVKELEDWYTPGNQHIEKLQAETRRLRASLNIQKREEPEDEICQRRFAVRNGT